MHAVGRQFGLASAPKIAHWVQTMRGRNARTSTASPRRAAQSATKVMMLHLADPGTAIYLAEVIAPRGEPT